MHAPPKHWLSSRCADLRGQQPPARLNRDPIYRTINSPKFCFSRLSIINPPFTKECNILNFQNIRLANAMQPNFINLVVAGDSIGLGSISHSDPWGDLNLQIPYHVENHSIGGVALHYLLSAYEGSILSDLDTKVGGDGNWLVIQAGTNDLALGRSAIELYSDAEKLASDAHNAGFKVMIATVLPREGIIFPWSSSSESQRIEYNNLVREGKAGADALADIAASPVMGSNEAPGKVELYSDWLHPTSAAVKNYIEPIYSAALSGYLDGNSNSGIVVNTPVPSTPVSTPVSTSIGSGSDKLVLKISEDAYKGDAQYTISVDGKQVDGTLTAHASHAANQSETITVNGDWASGNHQVSINFLNDTYEGSASADRNLYLDNATYNGADVSGSKISLTGGGAQGFWVHDLG